MRGRGVDGLEERAEPVPHGKQALKDIEKYVPPHHGLKDAKEKWRDLRAIRKEHGFVREYIAKERAENIAAVKAATAKTAQDSYSVQKLALEFIDHQSSQIKTWKETDRNLKAYVLPHIGEQPAHAVRRNDVLSILDGLTRKGNTVCANRTLAAVRKMFNWGIEREKPGIDVNPCTAIKPQKEVSRERVPFWRGIEVSV